MALLTFETYEFRNALETAFKEAEGCEIGQFIPIYYEINWVEKKVHSFSTGGILSKYFYQPDANEACRIEGWSLSEKEQNGGFDRDEEPEYDFKSSLDAEVDVMLDEVEKEYISSLIDGFNEDGEDRLVSSEDKENVEKEIYNTYASLLHEMSQKA